MWVIRKAFAYISSASGSAPSSASGDIREGRNRLLLLAHPDHPEAGLQVPAGTMEPGEAPEDAALREAREETGLTDLTIVAFLGRQSFDLRPFGRDEVHDRWFFHLSCGAETPERWRVRETTPATDEPPIRFELFWAPLNETLPSLIAGHDRFIPELIASLRPRRVA